ncbi:MAG: hypothetical protein COV52_02515 [Gammaproteobacteria bacterium CG11_big_fil_rev_8_21_14_0_20_46_22]|nr:MAG: hypothetical protein COW05_08555 [Gammaproteobacteria bacterium CG12_big_fil_rev_8_21_14_0_65_46_12]PIR11654.1 MAG: hypothetical protein COV52_02515 [Gammaproteobacteria bacterium CG11_big_fil_rev_8_21_14_0_20_46_22]
MTSKLKALFKRKRLNALKGSQTIRSDVRQHLLMEPYLRKAFERLNVSAKEADKLLEQAVAPEPQRKKGLFTRKKQGDNASQYLLRRMVRAHLNYLLQRSELERIASALEERAMDQQDVMSTAHSYPEALDAKALPPEQALTNLRQLKDKVNDQIQALDNDLQERKTKLTSYLDTLETNMKQTFEQCKNSSGNPLSTALTDEQKQSAMRILAGLTPDSFLSEEPNKDSPYLATFQTLKKLTSSRGRA